MGRLATRSSSQSSTGAKFSFQVAVRIVDPLTTLTEKRPCAGGKKCVFLLNLQRRILAGVESQCMILAAEDNEDHVSVLIPEKDIAEGSKIG
jgi:hypothetical protein